MPLPRDDRPGQPVYVIDEPPEAGETGLRAATPDGLRPARSRPARPRTRRSSESTRCSATRPASAGARGVQIEEGRSWLWRDGGTILFKAEASAWTPSAVQIQQVWVDPSVRGPGLREARHARRSAACCSRHVPTVCLFVRPENAPAIARLRVDRHAPHDHVPEPDLRVSVRRLALLVAALWLGRWLTLELASVRGHRLLPPGPPPLRVGASARLDARAVRPLTAMETGRSPASRSTSAGTT